MKTEILEQLKAAERDNLERVERARHQAAEVLKAARREAEKILHQADEESKQDQAAQLQAERSRLESERGKVLKAGADQEAALRQAYSKNVDGYVKKGLEAFKRALNA